MIIRKKERAHGTGKLIEGNMKSGDRILLVEDVTTTGRSVVAAAEIIRKEGGIVNRVLVVVDREEGASQLMEDNGLNLIPLVRASEMM
jgi:orotate phosphoribosyltransferase